MAPDSPVDSRFSGSTKRSSTNGHDAVVRPLLDDILGDQDLRDSQGHDGQDKDGLKRLGSERWE